MIFWGGQSVMFLGFLKKALVSLSVVFGGFGVGFASSVIDSSNSSNVFKTQIKQAQSSSTSNYNVGDKITIDGNDYTILETNMSLSSPEANFTFSKSSNIVYILSWFGYDLDSKYHCLSFSLSSDIILFTSSNSDLSSERYNIHVKESNLSYLVSPKSSGYYSNSLLLIFNKNYNFKNTFFYNSRTFGYASLLILSPYVKPLNPVTDSISIIVSGLTEFGKGLGKGISDIVTAMMYSGEGANRVLSPYFVFVLVFASVALCVSLTSLIFNWLRQLGGK